jgi:hypothetical protein
VHDAERMYELQKPDGGLVCTRRSEDASIFAPYDSNLTDETKIWSAVRKYVILSLPMFSAANNLGGTSDNRCELA